MDPESWREVRALFDELVELHADQQAERLAAIGATDPGLRDSVAALLSADSQADEQLGEVDAALLPPSPTSPISALSHDPFGLSGRTVAHFRIVEPLGVGGMGVVYRAEDLRLGRTVALKVPLPGYRLDASMKQRFLHEARSAAALDHPNLCSIYEVGESDEGHPFLAMPLYPGETLKDRLAHEGPLPVEEAVEIARQVAEGLAAAHGAGIVHRDIKPGNVMLLPDGSVKILDFGLAKVRDLSLTGSRAQLGTVAYMAPEQIRREPTDDRADLWAVGVVLYEMLTGRRPFEGEHEVSVAHAIVHEEPLRSSTLRGEIPGPLEGLLCALLRKEPARRPASAQQVAAELSALQSGRALPVRRASGRRAGRYRPALLALLALVVFSGVLGILAAGEWLGYVQSTLGMEAGESLLAAGALEERERILLADFENRTADAELARAVTAALRIDLAQSPLISLVEPATVREALERMERRDTIGLDLPLARELALREGIRAVLTGDVVPAGTGYVLSARLVAAETGESLTAHRVTAADSTRVIPAIDRLSKQLRLRIGESLRSTRRNPPLEQVTTSSLAALRKYSLAGVALDREGDLPRGLALLEEAIALDSLFAEAHRKLGAHYMNSPFHVQQARLALSRAYELRERLPDRERYHTIATYHGIVTGERDQVITAFRTLLDQYPDDHGALVVLGLHLGMNREYVQAEQVLRRAVTLQPTWQGFGSLASVQIALGRFDEARATQETFRRTLPHGPRPLGVAAYLAAAQGDYAEAEAHVVELRRTERNPIWRGTTSYWLGLLALIRGQVAEAERYFEDRAAAAEHLEQPGATLSLAAELAGIDAYVRGAPAVGIARLEKAVVRQPLSTLPPHERPYLGFAALYAEAGQLERARHYLSEHEAAVAQSLARKNVQLAEIVRGRIALASRRPEEALRHFRRADESDCPIAVLPDLARAFELARQPDSAIAVYERYAATSTPFFRIRPDAWWLPWIHERLGQLYEARGEQARAAEHYTRFLDLWQSADPELQPRVREARRRLAALAPPISSRQE